jgi:hypothetical protein
MTVSVNWRMPSFAKWQAQFSSNQLDQVPAYERETPGELIHIDIKKLGRIGSIGHRITGRHPGAVIKGLLRQFQLV